jgi:hypothetical protein
MFGYALPQPWWQVVVVPLRFLLLCSAMVPISLKVRARAIAVVFSVLCVVVSLDRV